MLSRLRRPELSSPAAPAAPAGSPCGGWWPWWWREACGASEHEDAAEGPGGSSLLWPGSPSASEWVFGSGWSHRWWHAAPFQHGTDALTGSNPPPKPPPCTRPGSVGASSPRQQLIKWDKHKDWFGCLYSKIFNVMLLKIIFGKIKVSDFLHFPECHSRSLQRIVSWWFNA